MSTYEPGNYVPDEQNEKKTKQKPKPQYNSLYMVTHLIISFFAVYLSWRCNNGFKLLPFLAALVCPYLYIIWALATKGGCGVFDKPKQPFTLSDTPTSSSYY